MTKRKALVTELPEADLATAAWAHSEIEAADDALKISTRVTEGLQDKLTNLVNEIAAIKPELRDAETRSRMSATFGSWKTFAASLNKQRGKRPKPSTTLALNKFGALHLIAASALEKHGSADVNGMGVPRICELVFGNFTEKRSNIEARGLVPVRKGWQNRESTQLLVKPCTRA